MAAEHLYRSKLPDIKISNYLPLHAYCFERLAEFRERPCVIEASTGNVYSYGEVDSKSRRIASGLAELGIGGDVVMLVLPNCPEFVFVFLGISRAGAVATTANPLYTPGEIFRQAKATAARVVVTRAAYVDKVRNLGQEVIIFTVDDPAPQGCLPLRTLEAEENELRPADIRPGDLVALPFSSGTTGLPKGVMLTHSGMVANVAQQVDGENANLYLSPDDVVLCMLPLFHIYALSSVMLCSLRAGAAVLVVQKFEIVALFESIQRFKVTVLPLVPPVVLAIAKNPILENYDLSSVRIVMSGAAPLGRDLEDAFQARVPNATLAQGYGMTEAGPVITMSLAFAKEPFAVKSGSCGTVVRNAEVKIIDPETGLSLPYNQQGEICIRGPQIMKGYINDPEATERTIDKDGWLHSGDVGYIDDDEELFIVDRLKELIKYKGFQVPPAEIEAILLNNPHIADAAVVPQKDEAAGEVPVAVVVKSDSGQITVDDIKQFVAKQVVFYKKLHGVYFVEAIPKSPSGKILRKDLLAKLATLQ